MSDASETPSLTGKHVVLERLQVAGLEIAQLVDVELVHECQAALEYLVGGIGGRRYAIFIRYLRENRRGDFTACLVFAVHRAADG